MKVSRSLKWTRTASMRSRKLARDMLLFWKRIDKEMVFFNLLLKLIDFMVQFIKLCLGGHCILSLGNMMTANSLLSPAFTLENISYA